MNRPEPEPAESVDPVDRTAAGEQADPVPSDPMERASVDHESADAAAGLPAGGSDAAADSHADTGGADAGTADTADPDTADHDTATRDPVSSTAAEPAKPKRLGLVLTLAAIILVFDQITKIIAVANLTPGESPSILGGLVHFSLIRNPGAAWSIGTGMTWILASVACIVVVVIIRMASKLRSGLWATSLGLILGGALGNLMDRFFRSPGFMRGHVVDFVSVFGPNAEYFPVFNVADSGISIGAILLVVAAVLGIEFDGTQPRKLAKQAAARKPDSRG